MEGVHHVFRLDGCHCYQIRKRCACCGRCFLKTCFNLFKLTLDVLCTTIVHVTADKMRACTTHVCSNILKFLQCVYGNFKYFLYLRVQLTLNVNEEKV